MIKLMSETPPGHTPQLSTVDGRGVVQIGDTPSAEEDQTIRVTDVEGKNEAKPSEKVKYKVTKYSSDKVTDADKQNVEWRIEVAGSEPIVLEDKGESIEIEMDPKWENKKIIVMPYLDKPSKGVSVETKVARWKFPIIIDLYKMPGLNEAGTDIADDMAYGYGVKQPRPIYESNMIQAYKDNYIAFGFNKALHYTLSNANEINHSIINPTLSKTTKDIYDKDDFNIIPFKGYTDEILFEEFRQMAINLFASDNLPMQIIIKNMINKFQSNAGGIFEDFTLNQKIKNHPSTKRYCEELEDYIRHKLLNNHYDINALNDDEIYFREYKNGKLEDITDTKKRRTNNQQKPKPFSLTPKYPSSLLYPQEEVDNRKQGYTIAINDVWATRVTIIDYTLDDKNQYKLTYEVTLWDHFGLNLSDITFIRRFVYGFGAWFTLQHYRGYRPFITKITFTNTILNS